MNCIDRLKYYLNLKHISTNNVDSLIDHGLISERSILKFLVRQEYHDLKSKMNFYNAQIKLSEKFCIPLSTIQSWIYKN